MAAGAGAGAVIEEAVCKKLRVTGQKQMPADMSGHIKQSGWAYHTAYNSGSADLSKRRRQRRQPVCALMYCGVLKPKPYRGRSMPRVLDCVQRQQIIQNAAAGVVKCPEIGTEKGFSAKRQERRISLKAAMS